MTCPHCATFHNTVFPAIKKKYIDKGVVRFIFREYPLDGLALRGMLVRGRGPEAPKGLIIFAHEYASDRHSCARYCRPLIEAGYDVFSFDFRGHGDSSREPGYQPRQWVTDRELADIQGAIGWGLQWLEQQGRPAKVGLFGISRGACAAILAAAGTPQVQAIVADGAFSSDTTLEALMKRWASIFAKVRIVYENHPPAFWRFLRWLLFLVARRQLNCRFPSVRKALLRMEPRPMLFIHGERDSYIPVEQTRMLYALAGQPKYLWIVPTAKHNQSVAVQPKRYAERTVAFFNRYLAEVPTEDRIFPGRFRSPDELEAAPLRLEGARQAQVG